MVTVTYDPKKTDPGKLAAVIAQFEYGVEEVAVKEATGAEGMTPYPAPLPEGAHKPFAEAFKRARAAGKPMVIDFWAPWCAPCVRLKKATLADSEVAKELEGIEVIFVNLDEHPQLAKAYDVHSIPDVFFVDAQGRVVDRLRAFEQPKPFLARLHKLVGKMETVAALGMSTAVPSEQVAEARGLEHKVRILGRVVTELEPEGAAARAGLLVGDAVLRLGSNDLYSADDIADFLSVCSPGERVALEFKRAGEAKSREVMVVLGGVTQAVQSGPRLTWQFSGIGQLPRALAEARAMKKKVLVGLSGAET